MDSRNHVMFATPAYFFFAAVAGIEPLDGATLWRIAPAVVGASELLTSAAATVWTAAGRLSAGWALERTLADAPSGGKSAAASWALAMNVTVPVGLLVELAMPLPPRVRGEGTRGGSEPVCEVKMGGRFVWRDGAVVTPPPPGVVSAARTHDRRAEAVTLSLQSGQFGLRIACDTLQSG
jgi:hypothetical protein